MSFTYSNNPSTSIRDAVRFLTGDTTAGLALLQDEELDYLLVTYTTARQAAIEACKAMLVKIAYDTLQSADGITRDLRLRKDLLEGRLAELMRNAALFAAPFVGGVSKDVRDSRREEDDLIQPAFTRDQYDYDTNTDEDEN